MAKKNQNKATPKPKQTKSKPIKQKTTKDKKIELTPSMQVTELNYDDIDGSSFLDFHSRYPTEINLIDYDKYEIQTEKSLFD
jgi:hypothetical protein